jgi:predicted transposase YbfD/YdcC
MNDGPYGFTSEWRTAASLGAARPSCTTCARGCTARAWAASSAPTQSQTETVYYLSSLPPDAERILAATRAHWSVENSFHWTLDVVFGEDVSRVRLDEAPENLAVIRHIALNLLKRHPSKQSLNRKRFRAALDDAFLLQLLTQF